MNAKTKRLWNKFGLYTQSFYVLFGDCRMFSFYRDYCSGLL